MNYFPYANDYTNLDPKTKAFLERTDPNKVGLKIWEKVRQHEKDNETALAEEMETTFKEMELFIRGLENEARRRKQMKNDHKIGDWSKFMAKEKEFKSKLENGRQIVDGVLKAMVLEPEPTIPSKSALTTSSSSLKLGEESTLSSKSALRIRTMGDAFMTLVKRFAYFLEDEGIPHNYPVPPKPITPMYRGMQYKPPPRRPLLPILEEQPSVIWSDLKTLPRTKRPETPQSVQTDMKSQVSSLLDDEVASAGGFLKEYAERDSLFLEFKEVSATKTVWQQEYVYSCTLDSIRAEGRGRRRSLAKQDAASQILRILISKQKKGKLPENFTPFTTEELEAANEFLCEVINFDDQLNEICEEENQRPPIFTPILNTIGNAVRCKALGFNAVGRGRTKLIARRLAAKKILEKARRKLCFSR